MRCLRPIVPILLVATICWAGVDAAHAGPMPRHWRTFTPTQIRAYIYRTDSCLAHIVDNENGLWLATRYGAGGSYGLPQAQPGSKMASAGRDWRTNPWTQLRWMRGYVNGRYGSSCGAWAFWQTHRWY